MPTPGQEGVSKQVTLEITFDRGGKVVKVDLSIRAQEPRMGVNYKILWFCHFCLKSENPSGLDPRFFLVLCYVVFYQDAKGGGRVAVQGHDAGERQVACLMAVQVARASVQPGPFRRLSAQTITVQVRLFAPSPLYTNPPAGFAPLGCCSISRIPIPAHFPALPGSLLSDSCPLFHCVCNPLTSVIPLRP